MKMKNNKCLRATSREKLTGKGEGPIKQRRGIVQIYTASVRQIGTRERKSGRKLGQGPMT